MRQFRECLAFIARWDQIENLRKAIEYYEQALTIYTAQDFPEEMPGLTPILLQRTFIYRQATALRTCGALTESGLALQVLLFSKMHHSMLG